MHASVYDETLSKGIKLCMLNLNKKPSHINYFCWHARTIYVTAEKLLLELGEKLTVLAHDILMPVLWDSFLLLDSSFNLFDLHTHTHTKLHMGWQSAKISHLKSSLGHKY